jgi:hypothetical protein
MLATRWLCLREIRAAVFPDGNNRFRSLLRLGKIWLTINVGGVPTDDKPEVLASPPRDPNILSIFLNLRVTDIRRYYDLSTISAL